MEHSVNRRWRGTLDVPLNNVGLLDAEILGDVLCDLGGFDLVIHDDLSRCRDTAYKMPSGRHLQNSLGPRPWRMGPTFEGEPITEGSIARAQLGISVDHKFPGGERFSKWFGDWMTFITVMDYSYPKDRVAVVTHNRNIQSLYATLPGYGFYQPHYDVEGPGFLSVHFYDRGWIAPWGGTNFPPGLYLIRHGETAWGT